MVRFLGGINGSHLGFEDTFFSQKNASRPYSRYVTFRHPLTQDLIDDVVVTFFAAPHSYTGEDLLEICCHGNPLISAQIHHALRLVGFRDAHPGEFTQRAFLNGKCDLLQAEAIQDLIHAESSYGLAMARTAAQGKLSGIVNDLRAQIIAILAYLEAHIDFAPEDVGDFEGDQVRPGLVKLKCALEDLARSYEDGQKRAHGLKIVIGGKPNAGKSSLYNALLQQDLAIVTPIAGTTRDVLRERLVIEGKDFVILDTAGLRVSEDVVEKLGVARSQAAMNEADVLLYCVDGSLLCENADACSFIEEELQQNIPDFEKKLGDKKTILVLTKADLLTAGQHLAAKKVLAMSTHTFAKAIMVSHHEIQELKTHLCECHEALWGARHKAAQVFLTSQRQQSKVSAAVHDIGEALDLLDSKGYPEAVASLVNAAQQRLAELLGNVGLDEVLDSVFSRFCIGK